MIAFLQSLYASAGQGLLWALLAIGVYISFRILDFPDLTVEGSFALGGSVVAVLLNKNTEPVLATLIAGVVGCLAGLVTGVLHTKLKIPPILAGILTMISLYSINLRIMGKANLSVFRLPSVLTYFVNTFGVSTRTAVFIVGFIVAALITAGLYWFFGTEFGSAIRATGTNEKMCRAQGIDTDNTKIVALMLSNALVALSGALVVQQYTYSDVGMGIGSIVIGLASVIIGEAFMHRKFPFWMKLIMVVIGSVIYRLIITIVIFTNIFSPDDLKLLTALIVIIALSLPMLKKRFKNFKKPSKSAKSGAISKGGNPNA